MCNKFEQCLFSSVASKAEFYCKESFEQCAIIASDFDLLLSRSLLYFVASFIIVFHYYFLFFPSLKSPVLISL